MSRARRVGVGIVGMLGVGAAITAGLSWKARSGREAAPPGPDRGQATAPAPAQEPGTLSIGLRAGQGPALSTLRAQLAPAQEPATTTEGQAASPPKAPPTATELAGWVESLDALKTGFGRYAGPGRVAAVEVVGLILDRLTIEGTPAGWSEALKPAFDILAPALSDQDPAVRIAALDGIGLLWVWAPGCSMTPAEEQRVAAWKEGLHAGVLPRLGADEVPPCRAAAVRCLGRLPIDSKAAPAVALIGDADLNVRLQVVLAFANRPGLLSAEAILPMLNDPVPDLRALADRVLKARGLSQELIALGRLITHQRADMRASAVQQLLRCDDIDPVVWLLRLSADPDASVRLAAVEALEGRESPEVQQRLRTLASDKSAAVRAAAARLTSSASPTELPPLPGMPGLNPRAN